MKHNSQLLGCEYFLSPQGKANQETEVILREGEGKKKQNLMKENELEAEKED